MTIRVRLFAILKDAAGVSEVSLTLPEAATVSEAIAALVARHPALAPHASKLAPAVNREYAPRERVLQDGDELALIPPVSGGLS